MPQEVFDTAALRKVLKDMANLPSDLKYELLPIDSLTPYEKNARRHETEDIAVIKASIEKFGFNDPVGVWGKKNLIVEGHGRVMALKELGWKDLVPCIRLDKLSDAERRAYAIAHNRSAEMSNWDFALLDEEKDDLSANFGVDFEALGFPAVEGMEGDAEDEEDFVDNFGDEDVLQDKELDKSTITFEVPREKLPLIRGYRSKFGDDILVDFILKTVEEAMVEDTAEDE